MGVKGGVPEQLQYLYIGTKVCPWARVQRVIVCSGELEYQGVNVVTDSILR